MADSIALNDDLPIPPVQKGLINPEDRISEILYGLIIALSFTCTYSVITPDGTHVKDMLHAVIGCNFAWGIVDAVMYLVMTLTDKQRESVFLNFVQKSKNKVKANQFIADGLPPAITSVLQPAEIEGLRQKLLLIPAPKTRHTLAFTDYRTAVLIFIIVLLSTFPIAIPFMLIEEVSLAMRISNLTAIVMIFGCGWSLGKYAGWKPLSMGILMSIIGIVLVLITILLGG